MSVPQDAYDRLMEEKLIVEETSVELHSQFEIKEQAIKDLNIECAHWKAQCIELSDKRKELIFKEALRAQLSALGTTSSVKDLAEGLVNFTEDLYETLYKKELVGR